MRTIAINTSLHATGNNNPLIARSSISTTLRKVYIAILTAIIEVKTLHNRSGISELARGENHTLAQWSSKRLNTNLCRLLHTLWNNLHSTAGRCAFSILAYNLCRALRECCNNTLLRNPCNIFIC